MKVLALLCLLFTLPLQQNQKPETVALVFGPEPSRVEFMLTQDAERLYSKLKHKKGKLNHVEAKTFAALTQALGVQVPHVRNVRERLDWEIRRGVRLPLQKPEPIKEVIQK